MYNAASAELAGQSVDSMGVWESAPWNSRWIPFPGRGQVLVEHSLNRVPRVVQCYLAFVQDGTNPVLAAGDLCRIAHIDEQSVTVWNDTNGQYFLRVVVH